MTKLSIPFNKLLNQTILPSGRNEVPHSLFFIRSTLLWFQLTNFEKMLALSVVDNLLAAFSHSLKRFSSDSESYLYCCRNNQANFIKFTWQTIWFSCQSSVQFNLVYILIEIYLPSCLHFAIYPHLFVYVPCVASRCLLVSFLLSFKSKNYY